MSERIGPRVGPRGWPAAVAPFVVEPPVRDRGGRLAFGHLPERGKNQVRGQFGNASLRGLAAGCSSSSAASAALDLPVEANLRAARDPSTPAVQVDVEVVRVFVRNVTKSEQWLPNPSSGR